MPARTDRRQEQTETGQTGRRTNVERSSPEELQITGMFSTARCLELGSLSLRTRAIGNHFQYRASA